jgi:hypothetical protein
LCKSPGRDVSQSGKFATCADPLRAPLESRGDFGDTTLPIVHCIPTFLANNIPPMVCSDKKCKPTFGYHHYYV